MKIHPVFHVSLLESYHEDSDPTQKQSPPPPVLVQDQVEYKVEDILDSRIFQNKLQYLVHWKGYTPQDATWEPKASLENSRDLIQKFHLRNPNKPSPEEGRVLGIQL